MKIFACYLKINQYRKAQIIKSSSLSGKKVLIMDEKYFKCFSTNIHIQLELDDT